MPNGELIPAADRFDERRRRAQGPFVRVSLDQYNALYTRIQTVYNNTVQPVISMLENAGYMAEAKKVSQICTDLIWQSRDADSITNTVRLRAEQELREIDPILYAHAFKRPDLSE